MSLFQSGFSHTHIQTYTHIYKHTHILAHTHTQNTYTCIYIYQHTYACTDIHTYTNTSMHKQTHTHIYENTHAYIDTHTYKYEHTLMHIYLYLIPVSSLHTFSVCFVVFCIFWIWGVITFFHIKKKKSVITSKVFVKCVYFSKNCYSCIFCRQKINKWNIFSSSCKLCVERNYDCRVKVVTTSVPSTFIGSQASVCTSHRENGLNSVYKKIQVLYKRYSCPDYESVIDDRQNIACYHINIFRIISIFILG